MNWISRIDFQRWVMANFIILAFLGFVLRYMISFPAGKLNYLFILHAHSHFAFAGWIFMALVILLIKKNLLTPPPALNWILLLTLICSFGMLISFSLQGYKVVSIAFSTLFVFVTYWFAYRLNSYLKNVQADFLFKTLSKAGVLYLVLSSLGPFALGILKANENTGIIYQNAIYFYLHFQMNGWMLFGILALVAKQILKEASSFKGIKPYLYAFIFSTLPLFFIFTLWAHPPQWVYYIAFSASIFNAASWFAILWKLRRAAGPIPLLIKIALLAISIKVLFQLMVCIPLIGDWTFSNRNLIIGYVHLLTIGAITPVIISQFTSNLNLKTPYLDGFYTALTLLYLSLLFIQPLLNLWLISIPLFQPYLLSISLLFCFTGIGYYRQFFYHSSSLPNINKLNQILYESNH